jgi:major membrane immunogen (membrane-anchored lipoprotein)
MKRIVPLIVVIICLTACKKTKIEPEGPTDIRVFNDTDQLFESVVVNTSGGEYNFGTINSQSYSSYHRFDKAYPKADISLNIGGTKYSTTQQDYTYMQYMGQMKITYKVFISNEAGLLLDTDVVPEGPL